MILIASSVITLPVLRCEGSHSGSSYRPDVSRVCTQVATGQTVQDPEDGDGTRQAARDAADGHWGAAWDTARCEDVGTRVFAGERHFLPPA